VPVFGIGDQALTGLQSPEALEAAIEQATATVNSG
jgi:predicted DsbA family dithiol-disulfide isomerase